MALAAALSLWAVFAAVGLARADFSGAQAFLGHPLNAVLLLLLISISFVHMHAGMRVVIEDYINRTPLAKASCLLANLVVCGLFGALAVPPFLKVALAARSHLAHVVLHLHRSPPLTVPWCCVQRRGPACCAALGCAEAGPRRSACPEQGVPDPLAHRRGPRRHLGQPGQYEPRRLALAHVRHRQGVGLARRPGRHRIPGAQRASGRL